MKCKWCEIASKMAGKVMQCKPCYKKANTNKKKTRR